MRILKKVTEHKDHSGYYPIPGFGKYVLSKDCKVINLERPDKILEGYQKVKGYVNFTLVDDEGNKRSIGAHRLLAITFLVCPGHPDDYVPNHIDEDPSNNVLANIEWLTQLDNVRYSAHKSRKPIRIDVRNLETGEAVSFDTIAHAARHFNIHVSSIRYRCELGSMKLFNCYQFKYGSNSWISPDLDSGVEKRLMLKCVVTGNVFLFHSQRDCADYLGISESVLSTYVTEISDRLLPGLYIARRFSVDVEWPTFENPKAEYVKNGITNIAGKTRGVVVTDTSDGTKCYFETAKLAAVANDILPTTLNWRLKKSPDTVHPDGKMYAYV